MMLNCGIRKILGGAALSSGVEAINPEDEVTVLDYWDLALNTLTEDDDSQAELNDGVKTLTTNKLGKVLTQGTAAQQPIITDRGTTRYVLACDDASSQGLIGVTNDYLQAQPFMVCLYMKLDDLTIYTCNAGGAGWLQGQISATGDSRIYAGAAVDGTADLDTNGCVFTAYYNGASSYLRLNGVQSTTGNAGTNTMDRLDLCNRGATRWFSGDIGSGIIATSDTKVQQIEKWVANGHGVTLPF